jgi:hypothetical protein
LTRPVTNIFHMVLTPVRRSSNKPGDYWLSTTMALLLCDSLPRVGGYVPAGFEGRLNDQMNIIYTGGHQEVASSPNDMTSH